jgi:hypothetical protein
MIHAALRVKGNWRKTEKTFHSVRFEVLTPMIMKSSIFLDMTPCSPLKINWHFCLVLALWWCLACLILHPWRWSLHVPLKHWLIFTELHSVISQKIELFAFHSGWSIGKWWWWSWGEQQLTNWKTFLLYILSKIPFSTFTLKCSHLQLTPNIASLDWLPACWYTKHWSFMTHITCNIDIEIWKEEKPINSWYCLFIPLHEGSPAAVCRAHFTE